MIRMLTRIPSRLAIGLVRGYQSLISPHMTPSCRFLPSCSEYSVQAFQKYGFFRGMILSVHRVMRCHPWGGEGYDPPRWYSEQDVRQPVSPKHDD